jgi:hypothetical protein
MSMPQGSPVSPVLSAIYTAYLLMLPDKWNNSSLAMYVDDGWILAWAEDWELVNCLLIEWYRCCEAWLRMANLAIEPDKSEVIYFHTPRQRNDFPPNRIHLPNPLENTSYTVQASDTVCYLGFFINHKLDWEPHITIMCNCARVSLKALHVTIVPPVTIQEHLDDLEDNLEDLENEQQEPRAKALVTPFEFPIQEDNIADDC